MIGPRTRLAHRTARFALVLIAPVLQAQSAKAPTVEGRVDVTALVAALREGSGANLARAQRGFAKAGASAAALSIAQLTPLLRDSRPSVRAAAAGALGALGAEGRAALTSLAAALSDTIPAVQAEAVWAVKMVAQGARTDVPSALVDASRNNPSPLVASRLVAALAGFTTPVSMLPRIDTLFADTARAGWVIGLRLLGRLDDSTMAVSRLTQLLDHPQPTLRAETAWQLADFGSKAVAALPRLERLRTDGDADVREAVEYTIRTIGRPAGPAASSVGGVTCGHRPVDRRLPTTFTVLPGSVSLRDDGRGVYRAERGAISQQNYAYSLRLPYSAGTDVPARLAADSARRQPSRWLALDLNTPVAGSGARALGIARDSAAQFHAFYMLDANRVIWNLRDIPVGGTVPSDRLEIQINVDGALHLLQLGPWALGQCAEEYANGGVLHGRGTTTAQITRTTEREFLVVVPPGGVGRLWDIRKMSAPVDRGLYRMSFRVRLDVQP